MLLRLADVSGLRALMSVLGALALCPRFGAMIGLIAATAHRIVVKLLARITAARTRTAAMKFARTVNIRTTSAHLFFPHPAQAALGSVVAWYGSACRRAR